MTGRHAEVAVGLCRAAAKVLAGWQHGRAKQVPTARRDQGHTKADVHKTILVTAAIKGAKTVGTP